ncbi:ABC transporter substrate-binding protein [Polaromonas sp.]|uniref:ABC transporter substrate-binding protein n=1 Tax=Polaromonas sp. TaxID=1869339 RepID=UPI0017B9E7CD|nr:ABC transporter substrate-binding protein [Polaromonas sp.]NMM06759.1 ABC transporter substrate-binding protein [Polaromonas sp.]
MAANLSFAQAPGPVRIGFVTDLSGQYQDLDGNGGAVAAQMAIDDFGGKVLGRAVELLVADHQNKPDTAVAKAREWIDTRNVSMILGGTNSAAALAISALAKEKKRVFISIGAGTPALTNEQCSPNTIHYAYDTVALSRGTGRAMVESGGDTWFFLTADYLFGHALQADTTAVVNAGGGKVVGAAVHPVNASDFASFMLRAQQSRAKVLALANGGADTINALKSAREFGVTKTMRTASLIFFISDIHSLGLETAQGLHYTTSWDWNLNDKTRQFGRRFFEKHKRMPTDLQAADYSATMNFLKAVQAVGNTDADAVMAYFKKTPLDDFYAKGVVRPDGRYEHDMYLMRVKTPSESKVPWDYSTLVKRMPGSEIFIKKSESKCALWR